MNRWVLVAVFTCQAIPAWTLFDGAQAGMTHAAIAGKGGIATVNLSGSQASLANPAALGEGVAALSLLAGRVKAQGDRLAGIAAMWSPGPDYSLGLSGDGLWGQGSVAGRETNIGLSGALALGSGFAVGIRGRWATLSSEGLSEAVSGQMADLGLHYRSKAIGPVDAGFELGALALNVVSNLPGLAWKQTAPPQFHLGLALHATTKVSLIFERGWEGLQSGQAGSRNVVKAGAEWRPGWGLALRGGYSKQLIVETLLGLGWQSSQWPLELDWAVAIPADSSWIGHRLSITMHARQWLKPKGPRAFLAQVLADPDNGRVRSARFEFWGGEQAQSWAFVLSRNDNSVFKRWEGEGVPPLGLEWDGRDSSGHWVDEGGRLKFNFETFQNGKTRRHQGSFNLEPGIRQARLGAFARNLAATQLNTPQLKPVLASVNGTQLQRLNIQMPSMNDTDVSGWEIAIQAADGEVIKTIKGTGALPDTLTWDGKDRQGLAIEDALGVQVVFSYKDNQGKSYSSGKPVFTQSSFKRAKEEARARPTLQLASLGDALLNVTLAFRLSHLFLPGALVAWRGRHMTMKAAGPVKESVIEKNYARGREKAGTILKVYDAGQTRMGLAGRQKLESFTAALSSRPGMVLRITGLSSRGDGKGKAGKDWDPAALSRSRMLDAVEEIILNGKYDGNFVLEVSDWAGESQGVLVEMMEK